MGKKPEYAAIFLLANALTGALTYILTLRSIAKQLRGASERPEVRIVPPPPQPPKARKRPEEPMKEETPEEIEEFNKAHPGQYL